MPRLERLLRWLALISSGDHSASAANATRPSKPPLLCQGSPPFREAAQVMSYRLITWAHTPIAATQKLPHRTVRGLSRRGERQRERERPRDREREARDRGDRENRLRALRPSFHTSIRPAFYRVTTGYEPLEIVRTGYEPLGVPFWSRARQTPESWPQGECPMIDFYFKKSVFQVDLQKSTHQQILRLTFYYH